MEFYDPEKETTKLVIDRKTLDKMNNLAVSLGTPPNKNLNYREQQQLMTIQTLIEIAGEYNVSMPFEISNVLLEGAISDEGKED